MANATVDTLNFVVLDVLGHGDAPAGRIPVPFPNGSTTSKVVEAVAPLLIPGAGEEEEIGLMAERELQGSANRAAESVGEGSGAVHGTEVHAAFEQEIKELKDPNIHAEVSYKMVERLVVVPQVLFELMQPYGRRRPPQPFMI